MKIYVNYKHKIKALHSTNDSTLTEYVVNREEVFGDFSDFRILNYCYKELGNGNYSIYPSTDLNYIDRFDFENKISSLEAGLANAEYAMMMGGLL